jgi:hypothetical protein
MVYEWKDCACIKADAQKVGEELEDIPVRNASSVLEVARNSDGELHKCFTWDDSVAAEKYRLDQARYVLRMIVTPIHTESDNGEATIKIRAYESVVVGNKNASEGMTYVPTMEALSDKEFRKQIMNRLCETIYEAEQTANHYSNIVPEFTITAEKLKEARTSIPA